MKQNNYLIAAAICAIFTTCAPAASAADMVNLHDRSIERINQSYSAKAFGAKAGRSTVQRHSEMLALAPDEALELISHSENSVRHNYRYKQIFRGVPIYGEQVVVSEHPNGDIRALFGKLAVDISGDLFSTSARLPEAKAMAIAKRAGLGSSLGRARTSGETAKKMIYVDDSRLARLVYIVSYSAAMPQSGEQTSPLVIVDANTGEVIKQWDDLRRANATGPGGNLKVGKRTYGGDYGYLDVTQSGGSCSLENPYVKTLHLSKGLVNDQTNTAAWSFPCPENTVEKVNGAYAPLNDAHYFGTVVYDMFVDYVEKPPLWEPIVLGAHYALNSVSAGWHPIFKVAFFGDGDFDTNNDGIRDPNATSHPVVSLDTVGHELSHAFTQANSSLIGEENTQAAAIEEGFADMTGEAAEFFMSGTNDFLVGADFQLNRAALRFLETPTLVPGYIDHASNWPMGGMEAHQASGVYSKAFFLLANTSGWDTKKAFQVFAKANENYWAGSLSFNDGACGVSLAALDLGFSTADVDAAFSGVGVACAMAWDKSTALGLYGGGAPIFSLDKKTIETPAEPASGNFGIASKATIYRNSGKKYIEFTVSRQASSDEYPYSGGIYLSLRAKNVPVKGDAGMVGDWALSWFADEDSEPAAVGPPWYRASGSLIWTHQGPLSGWLITEGDTIGIAADLDSGKLWYSLNGAWTGDPVTGAGPVFDQSLYGSEKQLSGKSVTPHLYADFQNLTVVMRASTADMVYSPPTGFVSWATD